MFAGFDRRKSLAAAAAEHADGRRNRDRMEIRRNNFDVTNSIDTTDVASVSREVIRVFQERYPGSPADALDRVFADVASMYRGEYPGYRACDTEYHNLQHTLDVTLAMARLMDGYERSEDRTGPIGPRLFVFGVVASLLHDIGYIRHNKDTRHQNGAEYTLTHVSRGGKFIEDYMTLVGMDDLASVAGEILHFTGYEKPIEEIRIPPGIFRLLGGLLGTADIIAQMSDRCYLEKCRDRLYPEFVLGGLATPGTRHTTRHNNGEAKVSSPEELVSNTPEFYRSAMSRLDGALGGVYRYAEDHFGGRNLYLEEIDKNVNYAGAVGAEKALHRLRRQAPEPLPDSKAGEDITSG